EQPKALGLVGGVITGARPTMPPPAPPQPALLKTSQGEESASSYAADAASKDAKQDYVNRRVLRADSETVEVTAESPVVMEAPAPKAGARGQQAAAQGGKGAPSIKQESLAASTMNFAVAPPQTTTPSTPPAATDTTLAKSGGFTYKLKSKLNTA